MYDTNSSQTSALDLSIIIVNFNTRAMTLECLRSIQAETRDLKYEIIVVDNDSADDSASAIKAEFSNVRLIALSENVGFARANITGAKVACGKRLLLLNPDTVILDRAIDRLVAFANMKPSCRIWGGRTLYADRSLNPASCWRKMNLWSLVCYALGLIHLAPNSPLFNPEAYGGWDRDTVRNVDIVSGCLFLIDRSLWNQLEGFDSTFFMYAEEADLCLRAHKLGANPIITPHATIIHYGGASPQSTVEQSIALLKGKATLVNRHWQPVSRKLGRALFLFAAFFRWRAYRLASRLIHRPHLYRVATEWKTIWQRRHEWIHGYAPSLKR